jgi:protein disulfide-isomerase A1
VMSLLLLQGWKIVSSVNFYQTPIPDVAKLFHIDPAAKRPSVVLLKK